MMWTRISRNLAVLAIALACACSQNKSDITKAPKGAATSDVARAYEKGMQEFKEKNYLEATKFMELVRQNYPYSQYASLAELALADMAFEREDWGMAANAYQDFVKSHPSHAKADYAAFRVGLANYEDKPSDVFLFPPSYEKDQTPIRQSLDALQKFVTAYPRSEYMTRARDLINECRQRLAAHDRYVAGFYLKRGAWKGAAGRLLSLADNYGDLDDGRVRVDSLWRAAIAFQRANDEKATREVMTRLVQEAPAGDPRRTWAEQMLKSPRVTNEAPQPTP